MSSTPVETTLVVAQDPPMVCHITPDGDVQCVRVSFASGWPVEPAEQTRLLNSAKSMVPGDWNEEKIELWLEIGRTIVSADLDVAKIRKRSGSIVGAVKALLQRVVPSILLFNFSRLPGNVMGAYYHNISDYIRLVQVPPQFANPVEDP